MGFCLLRFIIFSDSHGASRNMKKAIGLNLDAGLDGMIFLGDGYSGAKQVADEFKLDFYGVAGNCDSGVDYSDKNIFERMLEFDSKRILITHGHKYAVKSGCGVLEAYARSKGADIVMYGHTHIRDEHILPPSDGKGRLYVFNPGSIFLPDDGRMAFGLCELRDGQVLLSHGFMN